MNDDTVDSLRRIKRNTALILVLVVVSIVAVGFAVVVSLVA